jgi:hypothetical protein
MQDLQNTSYSRPCCGFETEDSPLIALIELIATDSFVSFGRCGKAELEFARTSVAQ